MRFALTFLFSIFLLYAFLVPAHAQSVDFTPPPGVNINDPLYKIGLIDVTKPPYNADPTGSKDSTQALQRAIQDAFKYQLVVFLPNENPSKPGQPSQYLISDTLEFKQDRNISRFHWYAAFMIGSTNKNLRPQIILKNNSPGFSTSLKPVIFIWTNCRDSGDANCNPDPFAGEGVFPGMGYSQGISNVDIIVRPGNTKALAIDFWGAQYSVLRDINIDMQSGYAGLYRVTGSYTVLSNIQVTGGNIGIVSKNNKYPGFNNIRLYNQTDYAITSNAWAAGYHGLHIKKASAPIIKTNNGGQPGYGHINLVDAVIEVENISDQPIVDNSQGTGVALQNAYIKNAKTIVKNDGKNPNFAGKGAGWQHLPIYSVADTQGNPGINIVNSTLSTKVYSKQVTSSSPPNINQVAARHARKKAPSPDILLSLSKNDPKICNAITSSLINHKDNDDDTQGIKQLLNQCDTILFAKGDYQIKETLDLKSNTHLIGVANHLSIIRQHPSWNPKQVTPLISTVNNSTATTSLTDLNIVYESSQKYQNLTAILWRAGGNSQAHNVKVSRSWAPTVSTANKAHIHITGNGGGHWSSIGSLGGNDNVQGSVHQLQRAILIEDTSQPLRLYNTDPEDTHSSLTNAETGAQMEIRNSQNVSIFSNKSENLNPLMINKSNNIFISNMGGQTNTRIYDSTNVQMLGNGPKFCKDNHKSGGVIIKENGQTKLSTNPCSPFSLFNGNLDQDKHFPSQTPSEWDLNHDNSVNVLDFSYLIFEFTSKYSFPHLFSFYSAFK